MKTSKIAIKWFVDFDKEEKWINDMAKRGWAFWHTNGLLYRFKQCEAGEFIYQIDFDERDRSEAVGDYVVFRTQCGDKFVHQWKSKIYWRRATSAGPFEAEGNITAKLHLTNKAFNYHLKSFVGLTLIAAIAFLILLPLGYYLPVSNFTTWLTNFSLGLTYGTLLAEVVILLPILCKLRKKVNKLIKQSF